MLINTKMNLAESENEKDCNHIQDIHKLLNSKSFNNENTNIKIIDYINNLLLNQDKKLRKQGLELVISLSDLNNTNISILLFNLNNTFLNLVGDKKSGEIRNLAEKVVLIMFNSMPNLLLPVYLNKFILGTKKSGLSPLSKWQTKVLSLKILGISAKRIPIEIENMMEKLVPIISALIWDVKKIVKIQAAETLEEVCGSIQNTDLEPFIPKLVNAISNPENVESCLHDLAGTTFVQTVTSSALSITVPLLKRGFNDKKTSVKRKCAVITENMAKLVKNSYDVEPFMPVLAPLLKIGIDHISDPECRERFTNANKILLEVSSNNLNKNSLERATFIDILETNTKNILIDSEINLVSDIILSLCNYSNNYNITDWKNILLSIIPNSLNKEDCLNLINTLFKKCFSIKKQNKASNLKINQNIYDEDVPDLCNLHFSLAYGSKILLNNSHLHLKRGYKYGIISEKSAGKTTMMRAISNGQVDGFPNSSDGVRSIFIENDIQGSQLNMKVSEYLTDSISFGIVISVEEAEKALIDGGFTKIMCDGLITQLSGGWKMKLALIRATLENADIMLMDEPTNHLDVINVQWVVDYINSLTNVTCLIVSHDSSFLNKTINHVIHFKKLKLNTYRGNISDFVVKFPESQSYFELGSTKLEFKFPQPSILDGIRTKGTSILSLNKCSFKYPSALTNQLNNVTVRCSMASRVAVVGANGAGKSTMIKLLTGEMEPTSGTVYKHPNCRFAYVAQHAFHHIEQHLDKTPNEYIRWRYEGGADKEARSKITAIITEEEKKIMEKPFEVMWKDEENGKILKETRVLEKIIARRKVKKELHYEVKWKNKSMDFNTWYSRELLIKKGFLKLIKLLDTKLASSQQQGKSLTSKNVEEHLKNVGLDSESSTHSRINDLSGGQKVKVVLAACTWNCPHLIILDEPTNYLDRDSLGALAKAIKNFEGGVVLITHNKEFADATTKVTWVIANNICDIKGDPEWEKYASEQAIMKNSSPDEEYDASGNKIEINNIKNVEQMTKQEVKKNKKAIKMKIKRGELLEEYEMDWADEWNMKYIIPE